MSRPVDALDRAVDARDFAAARDVRHHIWFAAETLAGTPGAETPADAPERRMGAQTSTCAGQV